MGEKAKKERAQVARLAKKAKRNAGQLSKPSDKPSAPDNPPAPKSNYPPEPTAGSANTNKQKLTSKQLTKGISLKATALISKSSALAQSNPPRSRSTSAAMSSGSVAGVSTRGSCARKPASILETRPPRQTAVAAQALLQQVLMSADGDSDASEEPQSDGLAEFDEDEDESLESENDQGGSDIEIGGVVVAPSGQLNLVAPKQKQVAAPATVVSYGSKKTQVDSEDSEDDEDDGESP